MRIGYVQNIIKIKGLGGSRQNSFIDMSNVHTCVICCPDLVIAMVGLMHGELLELTRDVVRCPRVQVPIWVTSRYRCHACQASVRYRLFIVSVSAIGSRVPDFEANCAAGVELATIRW
jgi:hypothetical protein